MIRILSAVVLSLFFAVPVLAGQAEEFEMQKKVRLNAMQDLEEKEKKLLSELGAEGNMLKELDKNIVQQKKGRLEDDCKITEVLKTLSALAGFLGSSALGSPKDGGHMDSLKDEFEKARAAFRGDCSDHAMREMVEKAWSETEDASLNLVRLQHVKRDLEEEQFQYKDLLKKSREQQKSIKRK